jgi:hypothetical protein
MVTANITVNAQWTQNQTGGGNNNDSGGSSGSGSGSSTTTTTTTPTTTWITSPNTGGNPSRSTGQAGIRAASWARFGRSPYRHDTIIDNAVQVRVTINNPSLFKSDTMLSGYVKGAQVDRTRNLFERFFSNKVQTISFDQQGTWDAPVRVAARVDLTGMDTANLVFYAYDRATNTYKRIENPAYRIDANGYLWFTTPYAGDIIISDGPLNSKLG